MILPLGHSLTIRKTHAFAKHFWLPISILTLYRCSTCHLNRHNCPGHCGHIELPVPVYHPNFMSQCLRLLRATCSYCHHFKLSRVEVHRYSCKLRLLQHGLAKDAEAIDDLDVENINKDNNNLEGDGEVAAADEDEIIERRTTFMDNAISSAKFNYYVLKDETISERLISSKKNFLLNIAKVRKCSRCEG